MPHSWSSYTSSVPFYGDVLATGADILQEWGWSLLPQVFGTSRAVSGGYPTARRSTEPPPVIAPVPVVWGDERGGYLEEAEIFYPVLPRPTGARAPPVPRTVVRVEDVSTEVEQYETGDFPAGSIFAPGRTWGGPVHELDTDPHQNEEPDVAFGDILDWGLETLLGQQDWQTFGGRDPWLPAGIFPAGQGAGRPSGRPATPPSAAPPMNRIQAMTNGEDCGNRRYVTLDRETGKISCKRRRRRRLLTNRDLADLASLKTITGGGAALNAAVIRAVR